MDYSSLLEQMDTKSCVYALKRLMEHNPISVREIFGIPPG